MIYKREFLRKSIALSRMGQHMSFVPLILEVSNKLLNLKKGWDLEALEEET
jgi:hypothetical protein